MYFVNIETAVVSEYYTLITMAALSTSDKNLCTHVHNTPMRFVLEADGVKGIKGSGA
jgi:hypothetical protein